MQDYENVLLPSKPPLSSNKDNETDEISTEFSGTPNLLWRIEEKKRTTKLPQCMKTCSPTQEVLKLSQHRTCQPRCLVSHAHIVSSQPVSVTPSQRRGNSDRGTAKKHLSTFKSNSPVMPITKEALTRKTLTHTGTLIISFWTQNILYCWPTWYANTGVTPLGAVLTHSAIGSHSVKCLMLVHNVSTNATFHGDKLSHDSRSLDLRRISRLFIDRPSDWFHDVTSRLPPDLNLHCTCLWAQ